MCDVAIQSQALASNSVPPRFLAIPPEIRNKIYHEALKACVWKVSINWRSGLFVNNNSPRLALLAVSKQIRNEALPFLEVHLETDIENYKATLEFGQVPAHMRLAVKTVRIYQMTIDFLPTDRFPALKRVDVLACAYPQSYHFAISANQARNSNETVDEKQSLKESIREGTHDEELVAYARERCLWDHNDFMECCAFRDCNLTVVVSDEMIVKALNDEELEEDDEDEVVDRPGTRIYFTWDLTTDKVESLHWVEGIVNDMDLTEKSVECFTSGVCRLCERRAQKDT